MGVGKDERDDDDTSIFLRTRQKELTSATGVWNYVVDRFMQYTRSVFKPRHLNLPGLRSC
jgi:hypothetical protein